MPAWLTLDRAPTGDGGEMTLSLRGEQYAIRVDGQDLMNSASHRSEEKLAVHACAPLRSKAGAHVLIGGLGMGFTARAALDVLGPDAEVEVVELVAAVGRWNREVLGHLAGHPLGDGRLRLREGDVGLAIAESEGRFDAILLDVDNGPSALTNLENKRLYSADGLRAAARALRAGGVLAVWSVFADKRFEARLRDAGFVVRVKRVLAGDGSARRHVLWLATPTTEKTTTGAA